MPSGSGTSNVTKLVILLVVAGIGFGGWWWYSHGLQAKSDDQLFEMVAGGGAKGAAAEAELTVRAKTDKTPVAAFRAHLKDAAPKARIAAINGLASKKDKDSAKDLLGVLENAKEDVEVRAAAAKSFADIRVKEAVKPLIDVLFAGGGSEDLRESASASLRSITGQGYSNKEKDKWKNWWDENGANFKVKE